MTTATTTTVVHLKRRNRIEVVGCDVYIGRAMYQGGWRLPTSKWANPFPLKSESDRPRVLAAYEAHIRNSPQLLAALPELRGKRLGCWCHPAACHGDVLVRLLDELYPVMAVPIAPTTIVVDADTTIQDIFGI